MTLSDAPRCAKVDQAQPRRSLTTIRRTRGQTRFGAGAYSARRAGLALALACDRADTARPHRARACDLYAGFNAGYLPHLRITILDLRRMSPFVVLDLRGGLRGQPAVRTARHAGLARLSRAGGMRRSHRRDSAGRPQRPARLRRRRSAPGRGLDLAAGRPVEPGRPARAGLVGVPGAPGRHEHDGCRLPLRRRERAAVPITDGPAPTRAPGTVTRRCRRPAATT